MDDTANLVLSGSVLVIALIVLAFATLLFFNAQGQNANVIYVTEPEPYTANASIGVDIEFGIYMHTQVSLTVAGNGTDFSVGIDRPGIPYGRPIVSVNSSAVTGSGVLNSSIQIAANAIGSNAPIPNAIYASGAYYALVTRLYPNAKYRVSLRGTAAPVCAPGSICPDFIMGINDVYNVTTGPNGSVVNISISMP